MKYSFIKRLLGWFSWIFIGLAASNFLWLAIILYGFTVKNNSSYFAPGEGILGYGLGIEGFVNQIISLLGLILLAKAGRRISRAENGLAELRGFFLGYGKAFTVLYGIGLSFTTIEIAGVLRKVWMIFPANPFKLPQATAYFNEMCSQLASTGNVSCTEVAYVLVKYYWLFERMISYMSPVFSGTALLFVGFSFLLIGILLSDLKDTKSEVSELKSEMTLTV